MHPVLFGESVGLDAPASSLAAGGNRRHVEQVTCRRVSRSEQLVKSSCFHEPLAIQIDGTRVVRAPVAVEPVAADEIGVWVKGAKRCVRKDHFPDIITFLDPTFDDLRAFDLDLLARCSLVRDPLCFGLAAAWRVDPLAVSARVHRDRVAGLRDVRGCHDGQVRAGKCPIVRVAAGLSHMEFSALGGQRVTCRQDGGDELS